MLQTQGETHPVNIIILSYLGEDCHILSQSGQESRRSPQKSPESICPHCGSGNLKIGAGKKPGDESRRCNNCKHFLGFSPLAKLKVARRRKQLNECLQILENSGIHGETAIFSLSLATDGGES
jgi:hypothetical protein